MFNLNFTICLFKIYFDDFPLPISFIRWLSFNSLRARLIVISLYCGIRAVNSLLDKGFNSCVNVVRIKSVADNGLSCTRLSRSLRLRYAGKVWFSNRPLRSRGMVKLAVLRIKRALITAVAVITSVNPSVWVAFVTQKLCQFGLKQLVKRKAGCGSIPHRINAYAGV